MNNEAQKADAGAAADAHAATTIRKLSIQGLRGYAEKKSIEFAQPDGSVGSGLTIIVGPNNSGKSTILEALMAVTQEGNPPTFSEGKRNISAEGRVRIELENSKGEIKKVATVPAGGSQTNWENIDVRPAGQDVFILLSRRTFDPFFGSGEYDRRQYIRSEQRMPNQRSGSSGLHLRLFHIIADEERRNEFDGVFRRVLDPVPDWTIDQSDQGQYYVKFASEKHRHSSEGLGEGLLSLLFVIDALYDSSRGSVIAIDEPELSLHPPVQRRLTQLISEYAKNRQIILSTHSPLFIDWKAIINGAAVVRVVKQAGQCEIHHLQQSSRDLLKGLVEDKNYPHVLGLNASEAFFLDDKVVLLEGQEDVLFYPIALKQLKIEVDGEFFGWGVGGADKMRIIASMLHDLGFKKVSGILDGNRAEDVEKLKKEFPDYQFLALPADDIRTKKARKAKNEVIGLLDENKEVRAEHKDGTQTLFEALNEYMGA